MKGDSMELEQNVVKAVGYEYDFMDPNQQWDHVEVVGPRYSRVDMRKDVIHSAIVSNVASKFRGWTTWYERKEVKGRLKQAGLWMKDVDNGDILSKNAEMTDFDIGKLYHKALRSLKTELKNAGFTDLEIKGLLSKGEVSRRDSISIPRIVKALNTFKGVAVSLSWEEVSTIEATVRILEKELSKSILLDDRVDHVMAFYTPTISKKTPQWKKIPDEGEARGRGRPTVIDKWDWEPLILWLGQIKQVW